MDATSGVFLNTSDFNSAAATERCRLFRQLIRELHLPEFRALSHVLQGYACAQCTKRVSQWLCACCERRQYCSSTCHTLDLQSAHIETVRSDFLRQFERVIATNPEELEGGRPKPGRLVAQVDVPANRRKTLRAAFQSRGSVVRHMGHLNTFSAPTS